jgi:hypothetical protein
MKEIFLSVKLLSNNQILKGSVASFLYRLIAIKIFNPKDFSAIIKKFVSLIQ